MEVVIFVEYMIEWIIGYCGGKFGCCCDKGFEIVLICFVCDDGFQWLVVILCID